MSNGTKAVLFVFVSLSGVGMLISALIAQANIMSMARATDSIERLRDELRQGQLCTLLQMGQHRVNSHASDELLARELGARLDAPAPEPLTTNIDPAVCAAYFARSTDG